MATLGGGFIAVKQVQELVLNVFTALMILSIRDEWWYIFYFPLYIILPPPMFRTL